MKNIIKYLYNLIGRTTVLFFICINAVLLSSGILDAASLSIGSLDKSYILHTVTHGEFGNQTDVSYFDGLGRDKQTVMVGASGTGGDLADYIEYDHRGLTQYKHFNVAVDDPLSGGFVDYFDLYTLYESVYGEDGRCAYKEFEYENTPLARKIKETRGGIEWAASGGMRFSYDILSEVPGNIWHVDNDGKLTNSLLYTKGEIQERYTVDEDKNTVRELVDRNGNVLQILRNDGSKDIVTSFAYDTYGNLRVIIPPIAFEKLGKYDMDSKVSANDSILQQYCHQMRYDADGNLLGRKLPGVKEEIYIYGRTGLLRFTQNGNQRKIKKWTAYYYDSLRRPGISAEISVDITEQELRAIARNENCCAVYDTVARQETLYGYTFEGSFPPTKKDILWLKYYDDHSFLKYFPEHADSMRLVKDALYTVPGEDITHRGEVTGEAVRILGMDLILPSAIWTDSDGRLCQSVEANIKGGYDRFLFKKTDSGLDVSIKHIHSTETDRHIYVCKNDYDCRGRLLSTYHSKDGGDFVAERRLVYDAIGRLSEVQFGDSALTVQYTRNIHNWPTKISSDKYKQEIYYEKPYPSGNTAKLNGAPCAVCTYSRTYSAFAGVIPDDAATSPLPLSNNNLKRCYQYKYDGLNRLTDVKYSETFKRRFEGGDPDYSQKYSYDEHGNVTSVLLKGITSRQLTENGAKPTFGIVRSLQLMHKGNLLEAAVDNTPPSVLATTTSPSLADGNADTKPKYANFNYDDAGNMVYDGLRSLTVKYNSLNLPQLQMIEDDCGVYEAYNVYDAHGRLLAVNYNSSPKADIEGPLVPLHYDYGGEKTFETVFFCGNHIYSNNSLLLVQTPCGYIDARGVRNYRVTDYMGNVAMVVDQLRNVVQRNLYYAYGELTGESYGTPKQPYMFGGKRLDSHFGLSLYNMGARIYDPVLCRFVSPDLLSQRNPGFSPFGYALSNPVMYIDPTGLMPEWYERYNMDTRLDGAATIMGGILQTGAGITIASGTSVSGVGIAFGCVMAVQGMDYTTNGFMQMVTGQEQQTLIGSALVGTGMSEQDALAAEAAIGLLSPAPQSKANAARIVTRTAQGAIKDPAVSTAVAKAQKVLSQQAIEAAKAIPGKGHARGSRVHKLFADKVNGMKFGDYRLDAEVTYLNHFRKSEHAKGSVRLDAVLLDADENIIHAFDLKTGTATFTDKRFQTIQQHLSTPSDITIIYVE